LSIKQNNESSEIKDDNIHKATGQEYRHICSNRNCTLRVVNSPIKFKSIESTRCVFCGSDTIEMSKCTNCGKIVDYEGKICKNCGLGLSKRLKLVENTKITNIIDRDLDLL